MTIREKLTTDVDEWNRPQRARVLAALVAAVGAVLGSAVGLVLPLGVSPVIVAAAGALVTYPLGWMLAAALD